MLLALLQEAYQRRGSGDQPMAATSAAGVPYQDLLPAIGRVLDAEGWRDLRLVEQPQGLVVQVTRAGRLLRGYHTYLLSAMSVAIYRGGARRPRGTEGTMPLEPPRPGSFPHPLQGRPGNGQRTQWTS